MKDVCSGSLMSRLGNINLEVIIYFFGLMIEPVVFVFLFFYFKLNIFK